MWQWRWTKGSSSAADMGELFESGAWSARGTFGPVIERGAGKGKKSRRTAQELGGLTDVEDMRIRTLIALVGASGGTLSMGFAGPALPVDLALKALENANVRVVDTFGSPGLSTGGLNSVPPTLRASPCGQEGPEAPALVPLRNAPRVPAMVSVPFLPPEGPSVPNPEPITRSV